MATKKKALQAAAGAAGAGEATYVDDVFSTYLYEATGTTNIDIVNNIDLAGEGGLVWLKSRTSADGHNLFDTERGANKDLNSNDATAENTDTNRLNSFNSDGFQVGTDNTVNNSGDSYASWTFRKAPGFFDVVTYTGDGVAGRTVSHNLGCVPGCIIVKVTSSPSIGSSDWVVYHKSLGNTDRIFLNTTGATATGSFWNNTSPTSTEFTLGSNQDVNKGDGTTYVAYLFADGDDAAAQIFGTDGDQAVVKCGSYTGTGAADNYVDVGFEPQFVIIKRTGNVAGWYMFDSMRGMVNSGSGDAFLYANASDSEDASGQHIGLTPTGFKIESAAALQTNGNGENYIYIAIRRPHKPAESGTEVFATQDGRLGSTAPAYDSGFVTDMGWRRDKTGGYTYILSRLTQGRYMRSSATDAEAASVAEQFDYMTGFYDASSANSDWFAWMFKRSPGFFDVVAYKGDSTTPRDIEHNLGAIPELVIVKARDSADNWMAATTSLGDGYMKLNDYDGFDDGSTTRLLCDSNTETTFRVGNDSSVNSSSYNYIAYLFASQDGISKVGSYTGNGTSQNIDCGFSAGARFVIIKRTDSTGDWHVWDTERGIVSGNDPFLELNTTNAENSSYDSVDPDSSGFVVNQDAGTNINVSSATYIYLAIA